MNVTAVLMFQDILNFSPLVLPILGFLVFYHYDSYQYIHYDYHNSFSPPLMFVD